MLAVCPATTNANIDEPGKTYGFVNLGKRNISLPGAHIRSKADPACWVNDATPARFCARYGA
ncbi:hypothetical protein [Acidisphaera sp. L21]|jgi:hypothetical protein|uniref:hypothetical protein n=1 Tax=Acidisphaera sp. L21 TaxID=1641851 RepID=UPI00131C815C|nr:hypothetical protein [Acidisphaera sp. L21]